jgi:hypothetical protein
MMPWYYPRREKLIRVLDRAASPDDTTVRAALVSSWLLTSPALVLTTFALISSLGRTTIFSPEGKSVRLSPLFEQLPN